MYARPPVGSQVLTFGVSGMLWKDALVMYDRQTDSLWSHVTGAAISGRLKGMTLQPLPSVHTTWGQWRRLHPRTVVLSKEGPYGLEGTADTYRSYFEDQERLGIFGTKNPDQRLPGKEYVLGIARPAEAVAYPYRFLSQQRLVNDTVGGEAVVILFSRATGVAFRRSVAGRKLTFEGLREETGEWTMRDRETGSRWRAFEGQAIKGSLAGSRLEQLPTAPAFWFAWRGFYPHTRLWQPNR